jgi:hypothetical protein
MRSLRNCVWPMSLCVVLGLMGCRSSASRVVPDTPDRAAASKAMELYDTNKDGFLDAAELESVPGLKAAVERLDANHDGKISAKQIAARIKEWADSKVGRMPVLCRVTHKGKPLAGAKVVFVPERFLGGTLRSGSGTTDQAGSARISAAYAADSTVRGMSPGFYRIEITKDGESIPANYNSRTTLGAEVASGVSSYSDGIPLELRY